MQYKETSLEWTVTPINPSDRLLDSLVRTQNETNRLLAAIGTLLEGKE